jgi:hypothetical protein
MFKVKAFPFKKKDQGRREAINIGGCRHVLTNIS